MPELNKNVLGPTTSSTGGGQIYRGMYSFLLSEQ